MNIAVRYYSRSGNTKGVAEAISVDSEDAKMNEDVDVLFVGGSLYAYGRGEFFQYLENIKISTFLKMTSWKNAWKNYVVMSNLENRYILNSLFFNSYKRLYIILNNLEKSQKKIFFSTVFFC